MRLNLAIAILIGLAAGWAVTARADAPPAAPIFYCPTPGKAAPPPTGPVAPRGHHHQAGCPTMRVAAQHHRWHGHAAAPVVASNDVSASQAFIYRYERAVHGLDARAADQAWAEGGGARPPCPNGCPGAWRHNGPPGPALAQREVPSPPCPHGCPGPDAWRHDGPPPMAEQGPPPMAQRAPPPPVAAPGPPPPPSDRAYAWSDGQNGYGYRQSERAGGWSYSEENGRGHYSQWGDQFGRPGGWSDQDYRSDGWDGSRRCPPPVAASACTAGQDPPPVYRVAGRDAAGYLTWPGKTPAW
jgi:hypothetical protein